MENWFSAKGRIGRWTFFLRNLAILAAALGLGLGTAAFLNLMNITVDGVTANAAGGVVELLLAPVWFIQVIKRCHDMDLSGWFSLLFMLPMISLALIIVRGTRGANKYGPDPLGLLTGLVPPNAGYAH